MDEPRDTKKVKAGYNATYYSKNAGKIKQHLAEKIPCHDCGKSISRSSASKHKNSCYPLLNRADILAKYLKT